MQVEQGKYGATKDVYFELFEVDGVDLRTDWTPAAADCQISTDGGAFANSDNIAVVAPTGTGVYKVVLSASEMTGTVVIIKLVDAATKVFLDRTIKVETYGNASAMHALDLDDAVRGGMTALPNANADAAGGLVISDAGGLDMDAHVISARRGGYEDGGIWIDTNASNTNTVSYVDGTIDNPVSTIAAATTIAGNLNIKKFCLVSGSSITLAQAYNFYSFIGYGATVALGGQSVNGAVFVGTKINGNDDGSNTNRVRYIACDIDGSTLGQFIACRCRLTGALVLAEAGTYFLDACYSGVAGTSTPSLDFGGALNASNVNMRHYSGGIEIENMGAGSGSYNMSLEGFGQLVVNANCSATSTIAIRGNFTISGDSTAIAAITFSDDARIDVDQINAECDTALADYAPATPAQVNAQVLDVMNIDTFAEPGQGAPGATISNFAKIGYIFKFLRNKITNDGSTTKIYNDAGAVVDQKATTSEAGGTVTRGEVESGP